ncbi:MAG: putative copper-binding protein [Acidimicrobiia bacterium]|nr:putative copper-binding protein [Acidimicrobiia bacterium]
MVPLMNRVGVLLAAATLTLPLALGGCGGDDKGSSGSATTAGAPSTSLQVVGEDIKFDQKSYEMVTGLENVALKNKGSQLHTLLIEQAGKKIEGFKLAAGPGKTVSGKVNLPAGTYTIYCDVVGHRSAGMEATLTVK